MSSEVASEYTYRFDAELSEETDVNQRSTRFSEFMQDSRLAGHGRYRRARQALAFRVAYLSAGVRRSDAYLVSFPRSGNTWVRAVLSNVLAPQSENPHQFEKVLPDISIRNALKTRALPSPRILKTHSFFWPSLGRLPRVVYLVRDGRDVFVSYYHYLVTRQQRACSQAEFLREYACGVHGHMWHENVVSWLGAGRDLLGDRLHVVRFEDLKSDPVRHFSLILDHVGVSHTVSSLERALERSSIERMRKADIVPNGGRPQANKGFYRGGKTGEWKDALHGQVADDVVSLAAPGLKIANY